MNEMDEKKTIFQKLFQVICPEKKGLSLEKKRLSLGGDKMIVSTMFPFLLGEGETVFLKRIGLYSLSEQFSKGDRD
jgi:hypothetical protein